MYTEAISKSRVETRVQPIFILVHSLCRGPVSSYPWIRIWDEINTNTYISHTFICRWHRITSKHNDLKVLIKDWCTTNRMKVLVKKTQIITKDTTSHLYLNENDELKQILSVSRVYISGSKPVWERRQCYKMQECTATY